MSHENVIEDAQIIGVPDEKYGEEVKKFKHFVFKTIFIFRLWLVLN